MLSERVRGIGLSPTLRISALAQKLRGEGVDVLDFSAGQPDFPTPESVKAAGQRAIEQNRTGYTANNGLIELRAAVVEHLRRDRGLSYEPEHVLISPGAKSSLYFAIMAMLDPGDEVLVPSPYWVSYPEQIRLAGAVPVVVPTTAEEDFRLSVERLEEHLTERTRMLILNYPSNPTGACYGREDLEPLAELCVRRNLVVLADEIYSRLLFDGRKFTSIAELGAEIRERTIVIDGASKSFSMTGWRIGWAAGPAEIIAGMARLQSHSTSNATSISQWATVEALAMRDDELAPRVREFQARRDLIVERLRAIPGLGCTLPAGAFYVFPEVSACFAERGPRPIGCGVDLAEFLLEEARVAAVPGDAFGAPDHLRLSFATSIETIEQGMERITAALRSLVSY